ncbi:dihydropteroate synthase [Listeria riparia]|nr:dihydropteroate synthase [Listeria riparia]
MVMGILNITPDSFSDGGNYITQEQIKAKAIEMANDGAAIIDIGGESTRPGYREIPIDEEIERVIPAIRTVRETLPDIWISIDTWKSEVALAAVQAGADIINDQWGAKRDPKIAQIAATFGAPIILMHNRTDRYYTNFMANVKEDLQESIEIVKNAGVPNHHILLDPGFGFVKTPAQNLEVLRRIDELVAMGHEVLLGTSRKSTIGLVLDLPVDERMEGTGATVVYGQTKGCTIFRVHDVKPIQRMITMTDAILGNTEAPHN